VRKLPFLGLTLSYTQENHLQFSASAFAPSWDLWVTFPNTFCTPDTNSVYSLLQLLYPSVSNSCLLAWRRSHGTAPEQSAYVTPGCRITEQAPWTQYLPKKGTYVTSAQPQHCSLVEG